MGVDTVMSGVPGIPLDIQTESICVLETPLDPWIMKNVKSGTPIEELISVSICTTDQTKTFKVGSNLSKEQ